MCIKAQQDYRGRLLWGNDSGIHAANIFEENICASIGSMILKIVMVCFNISVKLV